jgi:predicted lipid-binding transport protein (Tim44 family)
MSGLMGGLGGFLLGGLIGSLLFGGMGRGFFGGIGLLELLIIAGVIAFLVSQMRRRQHSTPALAMGYGASTGNTAARDFGTAPGTWQPEYPVRSAAVLDAPAPADLEVGLGHIRQMDGGFDVTDFASKVSDVFFKVQAAWMARDMGSVREVLTPDMHASLQAECDQLRAERRLNRLENIAVRSVDVTEAWQESGRDFVTVRFLASVLDYTVDESGSQLLDGSRTEPVKFEEYWTFVRPVGPNAWRLSAIQQAP